jgi:flagellar motor switch protein FliG
MTAIQVATLTNRQKSAILLISLDAKNPGLSQQLFSKMGESKSRVLLHEISKMGQVSLETIDSVIEEFYMLAISQEVLIGGKNLTDKYLKESFGIDNYEEFFASKTGLFSFVNQLNDVKLMTFLKDENPQVIALIMSLIPDKRSAKLLEQFDLQTTAIISKKMLSLEVPNYSMLWKFHRKLETHLITEDQDTIEESQQIFKLSRVLEMMVSDTRESVMGAIEQSDSESADKIKQLIFSFDDLIFMGPKDIQNMLVEIDPLETLAIAMTGISKELYSKIKDNISEKLAPRLDETISTLPQLSKEDIQQAQTQIVLICRKLEQEEKISPLSEIIEKKQQSGMSLAKKSKKIEEAVLTEEKAKENTEEGSKEKVDLEAQSETEDAIVNEENDDSSMDVNEEVDD